MKVNDLCYEAQYTQTDTVRQRDRYSPKKTGYGSYSMAVQNYDVGLNVLGCWADISGTAAV